MNVEYSPPPLSKFRLPPLESILRDREEYQRMVAAQDSAASTPSLRLEVGVLLTTGSYNPIHLAHVKMLEIAKKTLESHQQEDGQRIWISAGFLSPSHDEYVTGKLGRNAIPFKDRANMIDIATEHSDFLACDRWEGSQSHFIDFPSIARALVIRLNSPTATSLLKEILLRDSEQAQTKQNSTLSTSSSSVSPSPAHLKNLIEQLSIRVRVYYVCGADHFLKCSGAWRDPQYSVVCVQRKGYEIHDFESQVERYYCNDKTKRALKRIFLATVDTADDVELSSTMIRDRLDRGLPLEGLIFPAVASYINDNRASWKRR